MRNLKPLLYFSPKKQQLVSKLRINLVDIKYNE